MGCNPRGSDTPTLSHYCCAVAGNGSCGLQLPGSMPSMQTVTCRTSDLRTARLRLADTNEDPLIQQSQAMFPGTEVCFTCVLFGLVVVVARCLSVPKYALESPKTSEAHSEEQLSSDIIIILHPRSRTLGVRQRSQSVFSRD